MRLWSLHPKYLDVKGLVALWREGLLAQAVLRGRTRGYVRHPQLARFRERAAPISFIAAYLRDVRAEALQRGYRFSAGKIGRVRIRGRMQVNHEQLLYEWRHLLAKLKARDPKRHARLVLVRRPRAHPLFRVVPGEIAHWERGGGHTAKGNVKTAKDIDEYIAGFPRDVQRLLEIVRSTIRMAAPGATEKISYQIPTFTLHGRGLLSFAAFKGHIGLYPGAAGIKEFKSRLSGFKTGKGSVQFPLAEPLPRGLVREIVEYRAAQNLEKAQDKRRKNLKRKKKKST